MNNTITFNDAGWDQAATRQLSPSSPIRATHSQDEEAAKTHYDRRLDFLAWQKGAES